MLKQKYKAITLLETSVYLALFALLFASMMQFYFTIGDANRGSEARLQNQRLTLFLSEHMDDTLENSDSFDPSNSSFDNDNSVLRFTFGSEYKEYYIQNGSLYLTDGTDTFLLTPPDTEVAIFHADVSRDEEQQLFAIDIDITIQDTDVPNSSEQIDLFYISQ